MRRAGSLARVLEMALRGRSGLPAAAVLLVILALTGKLAFLTLSKKQLQGTAGAVSLMQVGQSSSLDRELASLVQERGQLAAKYAEVTAAQREKTQQVREEKELFVKEHRELGQLAHIKREMAKEQEHEARTATHRDEAMVKKMVHAEFQHEELVAKRRRAQAERAALGRKRAAASARLRLERQEVQAEARTEAKRELASEGLIALPEKQATQKQRANAELLQHERNIALEKSNARLEAEERHMAVALQWAPKHKAHAAEGVGGRTGIGDPLAQAGVVESSWGPLTSTAATRPDPRDSFAQDPLKEYKYSGKPYALSASEEAVIHKGG